MNRLLYLVAAVAALAFSACATQSVGGAYSVKAFAPNNPQNVRVKVSTSTQNIYVLEGDRLLMGVQGCVGANGSTPKGTFRIGSKIKTKRRVSQPDAGYPMAYWCEFSACLWIPRRIRLGRSAHSRVHPYAS
jgi:hypothetical protein